MIENNPGKTSNSTQECQTLNLSKPGSDYMGSVSVTASGKTCQNWQSDHPHTHKHKSKGNHNFCRNDDDATLSPKGVWCYTTDPKYRWEYC